MIRFLNFLALVAVIGSATWAYSVKYETILVAEKLKKRNAELRHERDAIAVLEAEWQLLNRPARLAGLAKPLDGMGQMSAKQVAQPKDIPAAAPAKADVLDGLLTGSLPAAPKAATPGAPKATAAKPGASKAAAKTAVKSSASPKKEAKASEPKAKTASAAPLPLAPKAGAAKTAGPKANAPKTAAAPKAGAPVKISPPANVGQSAPQKDSAGLGALFKKILN